MAGFDPTSPLLVRAGKVRSGADTAVRSRSRGRAAWVEVGLCCAGKLMHAYLNTARGQPQPIRSDASRRPCWRKRQRVSVGPSVSLPSVTMTASIAILGTFELWANPEKQDNAQEPAKSDHQ
jgi:hypothetical protein